MCYPATQLRHDDRHRPGETVEAPAFDALQRQVRAPLVTRSHPAYDGARRVWNGMIDRRPLLIVRPESAREVASAVTFAREQDLPLSVKGGGHGVAGRAVCDDGLVVDLCRMGAVQVDPAVGMATVQGGATLRALDYGSQAHGLATTAGIYRETGVAGLALGGGVGLLMRRFGLTCDNLLAAEVVTADGRVLEASEREHPDLFWALRGGGGNFGVITRMDFRLYPLTHVFGGRLTYDFADALALGRVYRDVIADAPEELQAYLTYSTADGEKTASVMLCHCGPCEAGEAVLDRFRSFRRPVVEHVRWITYLQMQQHWDDSFPAGKLHFWKSSFLATISDDAIRIGHEAIARQSMPGCEVDLEPMGGAISSVAPDATAFADRDAASTLLITTGGTDPHETEARIAWARETWNAFQPHAKASAYVNYLDQGDEHRTEAVYGPNFQRLVEVKRMYDPENIFRHNANIRP
jgi:FAD/FMN-containing dehydrogenase